MVNFDLVIDELDDNTLREFQKKLLENDCYQGLLNNVSGADETDLHKLRKDVKVGVQGAGYEKLRDIGPESIKREIESIDNTPITVQEPEVQEAPPGLQAPNEEETKEKLIQELIHISSLRIPGIGVPAQYRDRYGQILTKLNELHSMTHLDIQRMTQISNKTVAKSIAQYKEKHPIERPDDRVLTKSESKVAEKLTAKVTAKADEIIEGDMELAIHIRDTYLKEAYLRGISLRELVDTAIPIWFNIEGIYNTMMNMERETLTLKEHIRGLTEHIKGQEFRNFELSSRNAKLNRILISTNI